MIQSIIVDQEPSAAVLEELLTQFSDQILVIGRFSTEAEVMAFPEPEAVDLMFLEMRPQSICMLREMRRVGRTTPVILLTGAADPAQLEQAMSLGIADCLLKPFDPARLRHSIQNFLVRDRILHSPSPLTQVMVDHLLHRPLPSEAGVRLLPKGLSQRTLGLLENLLRQNPDEAHTCESLAAVSGLSKVTVRNYLNYLIQAGRLSCTIDYETGGRPRVVYHLI